MSWEIDVPKVPFRKPIQIEELEKMEFHQLEAMDQQEIKERIEGAAEGLARAYHAEAKDKGSYEQCTVIVAQALTEMGGSLGGKAGARIVGSSYTAAAQACKDHFNTASF